MTSTSNNRTMLINLVFLVGAVGVWLAGEEVTARLNRLPIKSIPKTSPPTKPVDPKTLYPVLVQFKNHHATQEQTEDTSMDSVFAKKEVIPEKKAEPALPAVDHLANFVQSVRLTGIGIDGAFINTGYYRIDDPIFELATDTEQGKIVPKLAKIDKDQVSIQFGKRLVTVRLQKQ